MTTIGYVLAVLTVSTVSLTAHHSYTSVFDVSKKVTLTGTLTKVDWRNPHIEISLDAKGDRGQMEAWVIEGRQIFSPKKGLVRATSRRVSARPSRWRCTAREMGISSDPC